MRSLVIAIVVAAGCAHARAPAHHAIRTSSADAQRHFDRGLALAYGFNFDEASYEMLVAIHADPSCALCWWGLAYVAGPNINERDKEWPAMRDAALRAQALAQTPLERALAAAVVARAGTPGPEGAMAGMAMGDDTDASRTALDAAYADAMRAAAAQFPDDVDVQVLAAEAAMLLRPETEPWFPREGPPKPWFTEARARLVRALAAAPEHIGAIHFYIHLLESTPDLALAVPYADKLARLAPHAGHLIHMASHLYLRLGRYADADDANRRAMAVDREMLRAAAPGGTYAMFATHPEQFLWHVLLWEGASAEALTHARAVAAATATMTMLPAERARDVAAIYVPVTLARFGRWDDVLALPDPPGPRSGVFIHFARGLAKAAKHDLDGVPAEIAAIRTSAAAAPEGLAKALLVPLGEAAAAQLEGALAEARGDHAAAITALAHAVELERAIPDLGEPPPWVFPARERLGAVLIAAGKPGAAAAVYREDLEEHPENGWALFGLATALDAQHEPAARAVWERFRRAWARADVTLAASAY